MKNVFNKFLVSHFFNFYMKSIDIPIEENEGYFY